MAGKDGDYSNGLWNGFAFFCAVSYVNLNLQKQAASPPEKKLIEVECLFLRFRVIMEGRFPCKKMHKSVHLIHLHHIFMTTRTIGIKEFRQNISKLSEEKNVRFIVMNHSKPIFRVEPIDEDQLILEKYADQIDRGLHESKNGKTTSAAALRKRLKL